jgi:hypothetical protein
MAKANDMGFRTNFLSPCFRKLKRKFCGMTALVVGEGWGNDFGYIWLLINRLGLCILALHQICRDVLMSIAKESTKDFLKNTGLSSWFGMKNIQQFWMLLHARRSLRSGLGFGKSTLSNLSTQLGVIFTKYSTNNNRTSFRKIFSSNCASRAKENLCGIPFGHCYLGNTKL